MTYDPEYTRTFYNAYGDLEWQRLEATPYGRLQAIIHEDILKSYIKAGDRVLDAGAGPGRFSIVAAKAGAKVTVLDISDKQIEMAKQKITEAGLNDSIENFIRADICNLSMFTDGEFDAVVCFGGALSYVCENRQKAADELIRVTKPGGTILVSAMSRLGSALGASQRPFMPLLQNPEKGIQGIPPLWGPLETGDLPGFPSRNSLVHAAMHMFKAEELVNLFKKCLILEIAGSNVTIHENASSNEEIAANYTVWATVIEMEKRLNHEPGLVDTGSHIILVAAKEP